MRTQQQGLQTVRSSRGNHCVSGRHFAVKSSAQGCTAAALEALQR